MSHTSLHIESARSSARLVLSSLNPSPVGAREAIGSYSASLTDPGLSATTRVVMLDDDGLPAFMKETARMWRGWDGVRQWASLEGQLELSATSDRLGHVEVGVLLRPDAGSGFWEARIALMLEAGGLDRLADDVSVFFRMAEGSRS